MNSVKVMETMMEHVNEGIDPLCERLDIDRRDLCNFLSVRYGDMAPIMVGFIVVGLDLERKRQVVGVDPEPIRNRDDFLASIEPDHDPEGT